MKQVLTLLALVLYSCTTDLSQRYIRDGARAETEGHYHQAIQEYTRALSYNDPKTAEMALYRLGFIHETYVKDYKSALKFYRQLIARRPSDDRLFETQKRIAEIEMNFLNLPDQAVASWTALLTHFPTHKDADQFQFNLAKAYLQSRKIEQARVELEKIVKNYPKSQLRVKAELEIAKSYYVENNYTVAEKEIKEFIKNYPNELESNEAKFVLAHVFEENDDLKNAVKIYQDLLNSYSDPNLIKFKLERVQNRIKVRGR